MRAYPAAWPRREDGSPMPTWRVDPRERMRLDWTSITATGYRNTYCPWHPHASSGGYVPEHRLIAERTLGRLLERDEVVHHINGSRGDNRPENLIAVSQAEHIRIHARERALRQEEAA